VVAELILLGWYGAGHGALGDAGDVGGEGVQGRASGARIARGHLGAGHAACCQCFHLRDSVGGGGCCRGVWRVGVLARRLSLAFDYHPVCSMSRYDPAMASSRRTLLHAVPRFHTNT
jgi:hypothetical protein